MPTPDDSVELKIKPESFTPAVSSGELAKLPIGAKESFTEKQYERPYILPGETDADRKLKAPAPLMETAMRRHMAMQAAAAKAHEQDAALDRLSTELGHDPSSPMQYELLFEKLRTDESVRNNPLARKIAAIEIQKRHGIPVSEDRAADVFWQIEDYQNKKLEAVTPRPNVGQQSFLIGGSYRDEAGNIQTVSSERLSGEQDIQRRQRKALGTSKFGSPEAVLLGMDLDDDLMTAFMDPQLDMVNLPLYRTSDGTHAFDIYGARSKLADLYYRNKLAQAGGSAPPEARDKFYEEAEAEARQKVSTIMQKNLGVYFVDADPEQKTEDIRTNPWYLGDVPLVGGALAAIMGPIRATVAGASPVDASFNNVRTTIEDQGILDYIGALSLGTSVGAAIHAGGWNTPEHIELIRRGYDITDDFGNIGKIMTPKFLERESLAAMNKKARLAGKAEFPVPDATFETLAAIGPMLGLILIDPDPTLLLGPIGKGAKAIGKGLKLSSGALQTARLTSAQKLVKKLAKMTPEEIQNGGYERWLKEVEVQDRDLYEVFRERLHVNEGIASTENIGRAFAKRESALKKEAEGLRKTRDKLKKAGDTLGAKKEKASLRKAELDLKEAEAKLVAEKAYAETWKIRNGLYRNDIIGGATNLTDIAKRLRPVAKELDARRTQLFNLQKKRKKLQAQQADLVRKSLGRAVAGRPARSGSPVAIAAAQYTEKIRALEKVEAWFSSMGTVGQQEFFKRGSRFLYKNFEKNDIAPRDVTTALMVAFPKKSDLKSYLLNRRDLARIHNEIHTGFGSTSSRVFQTTDGKSYRMVGDRLAEQKNQDAQMPSVTWREGELPEAKKPRVLSGKTVFLGEYGIKQFRGWQESARSGGVASIEGDKLVLRNINPATKKLEVYEVIQFGKTPSVDARPVELLGETSVKGAPVGGGRAIQVEGYNQPSLGSKILSVADESKMSLEAELANAIGAKGFLMTYDKYVKASSDLAVLMKKSGATAEEIRAMNAALRKNADETAAAAGALKVAEDGSSLLMGNNVLALAKEFDRSIDAIKPKVLNQSVHTGRINPWKGALKAADGGNQLLGDVMRKNLDEIYGADVVTRFFDEAQNQGTITTKAFEELITGAPRTLSQNDFEILEKGIMELEQRSDTLLTSGEELGRSLMNQMRSVYRTGLKNRTLFHKEFTKDYPIRSFVYDLKDSLRNAIGLDVGKYLRGVGQGASAAGYSGRVLDAYKTALEINGSLNQDISLVTRGYKGGKLIERLREYLGGTKAMEVKGGNFPETFMNTAPVSLFEQAARQAMSNQSTVSKLETRASDLKSGIDDSFNKKMTLAQKKEAMADIEEKLASVGNNARDFIDLVTKNGVKGFTRQDAAILIHIRDYIPKDMPMVAAPSSAFNDGVRGYYKYQINPRNNEVRPMGIWLRNMDGLDELGLGGTNPVTIVHELLHTATVQKMMDYLPFSREGRRVVKMSDEAKQAASEIDDLTKFLTRAIDDDALLAKYGADLTDEEIAILKSWNSRVLGTAAGPYELITYTLTSPVFQTIMKKIKSPDEIKGRPESLWSKFMKVMNTFMGLDKVGIKDSYLARVADASDRLITSAASKRPKMEMPKFVEPSTIEEAQEKFNKTLLALSRLYLPSSEKISPQQAGALAHVAMNTLSDLMREGKMDAEDIEAFMNAMKSGTKRILDQSGKDVKVAEDDGAYTFFKEAVVNGVVMDEASRVAVNTFGSMSDELVDNMNKILVGDFKGVGGGKAAAAALNKLVELGLATTTRAIKKDIDDVGEVTAQLVRLSEDGSGHSGFVPQKLMDDLERLSGRIVKSLEVQQNKDPAGPLARAILQLKTILGYFRASITTGLLFPNPRYWVNNIVGDFSQIFLEEGLHTAAKLSFQNLPANLPFIGRPMQDAMFKASASLEGVPVLGTAMNALFNPNLNKIWSGSADDVIKLKDGRSYTVGTVRRMMAEDGVMDTFVQETLLEGLRDAHKGLWEFLPNSKLPGAKSAKKVNEAIQKHATFVQQRQRAGLYMELLNRGGSRTDAKRGMMNALYDWKKPLGKTEVNVLAQMFTFWRFQRLASEQLFRNMMLSTRDGMTGRRVMGLPLPSRGKGARTLGRIREMEQGLDTIPAAAYHMEGAGEEGQAKTYEEARDAMNRDIPFWWQASRATAYSMPIMDPKVREWYKKRGYDFTYQDVLVPPFTPLDMANQWLGAGMWAYMMGMGLPEMAGLPSPTGQQMTSDATSALVVDPLTSAMTPGLSAMTEIGLKNFSGGTQYVGGGRTYLRPHEADTLASKLMFGGVRRDENGRPYVDGEARSFVILMRSMPIVGTQLPQYYAAVDNPNWVKGYGPGMAYMMTKLMGIAPRPKAPERELKYPIKERKAELQNAIRSAKAALAEEDFRNR